MTQLQEQLTKLFPNPARPIPGVPASHRLMNLTSHNIRVFLGASGYMDIPASGQLARVTEPHEKLVGFMLTNGRRVRVTETKFGEVIGLPAPEPGVYYVVSRLVATMAPHRRDLIFPDGAVKTRGTGGSTVIEGCRGFARIPVSSEGEEDA